MRDNAHYLPIVPHKNHVLEALGMVAFYGVVTPNSWSPSVPQPLFVVLHIFAVRMRILQANCFRHGFEARSQHLACGRCAMDPWCYARAKERQASFGKEPR